jgi:hypothetical protein
VATLSPANRARAFVPLGMAAVSLCLLVADAFRFEEPLRSPRRTVALWNANRNERLLRSTFFGADRELVALALQTDAEVPLESDVTLVVDAATSDYAAERMRCICAYLLAPRRVTLERGAGVERSLHASESRAERGS